MNNGLCVLCKSEQETDLLGLKVANAIRRGIMIALNGQLGAGKTRFVRALCQGLGVAPEHVSSPTFVLLQQYVDGRIPVAHMDTWRLADTEEFVAIGADEYLYSGEWVTLVEWADRVSDILPPDRLEISIHQVGENEREFVFHAMGPESTEILKVLSENA